MPSVDHDVKKVENKTVDSEDFSALSRRPRAAAAKSRARSHRMAMEKVISIASAHRKKKVNSEEIKKEKKKWITILFNNNQQQPHQLDLVPQDEDNSDGDDEQIPEEVNQDESEYGSEASGSSRPSEGDHNEAFLESPEDNSSMASMTNSDRLDLSNLFNSSSNDSPSPSLEWDNSPTTLNLTNPLDPVNLFEVDDCVSDVSMVVNMSDPAISTPAPRQSLLSDDVFSQQCNSPISPFRRVTRSMLSSGEFSLFSSASEILSPFQRQNPLRRPLRVEVHNATPNIKSADKRAKCRPAPLTGSVPTSPQLN